MSRRATTPAVPVANAPSAPKPARPDTPATETGELLLFAGRSLRGLLGAPRYMSEALRHAGEMVSGTTLLLFSMCAFGGFTSSTGLYLLLRPIGATDYTGLAVGLVIPRLICVIMIGYVFASKVGCGMTATLGAAKVNEELDAYSAEGVDRHEFLVGTRLAAALLYVPIGTAISLLGAFVGAYVDAVLLLGVPSDAFVSATWAAQNLGDALYTFANAAVTMVTIVIVACFYGFRSTGGPAGVGDAVSRSVTVNLILVHLIGAVAIILVYGGDAKLAIGG